MVDYSYDGDDFLDGAPEAESATPVDTGSPQAETVESAPSTPTPEPSAEPQQPTLSPEVSQLISRERLPAVPGETDAAAMRRLYDHQRQRADRLYYEEVKGAKSAAQAAREELAAFKEAMTPLITAFNERRAEAEKELLQAQIPEVGSTEYLAWQQQQILNRLEAAEKRQDLEREQATIEAAEEQLLYEDEQADAELEHAITSDPDAKSAYEFAIQMGVKAVARAYPNASREQILKVV